MNRPPLTLAEQKDYVRRFVAGCEAASAMQVEEARGMSEAEKWERADRLLTGSERSRRTETSGLVEQQRLFMKLHRRP